MEELKMDEKLKTGTTTVGIVCQDGIVLGADLRATSGNMIVDKEAIKIVQISDSIAVTFAGVVSDIQLITKLITAEIKLKEIRTGKKITLKATANLLGNMVYSTIRNPYFPGIAHFLMGGIDIDGFHLYDIYPDGSVTLKKDYVSSGSGSVFAYGVLEIKYNPALTVNDGVKLVRQAINAALQRDSASGQGIRIVTITKAGLKEHSIQKVSYELK
ncbi:MAG: proteasome subunit beta [Nanoarchaeota archaeon]|nr:proteasome subunit beta [Nanoarchaeota archaeon]